MYSFFVHFVNSCAAKYSTLWPGNEFTCKGNPAVRNIYRGAFIIISNIVVLILTSSENAS